MAFPVACVEFVSGEVPLDLLRLSPPSELLEGLGFSPAMLLLGLAYPTTSSSPNSSMAGETK
eukprot:8469493-Pyramimonas_sp.AAC.1